MTWCEDRGIELRYPQPGKPDRNAFIERFIRTYGTEVLNAYVFESLEQVREITAEWLQSYNEERPHDAVAGLPSATYRANVRSDVVPVLRRCLTRVNDFFDDRLALTLCDKLAWSQVPK